MEGIYLTNDELQVLSRCSGVAVKCYLRMRARMDLLTCVVGLRTGISYQALREWSAEAVEKGAGEREDMPSMRNVRTAVEQLIRRGLLVRTLPKGLVFRCVLARTPEIRSKRTRHKPDTEKQPYPDTEPDTEPDTNPTRINPNIGAGFGGSSYPYPDTEPDTERDTNPTDQNRPNPTNIGVGGKPYTHQAAYTEVDSVAREGVVEFAAALARKSIPEERKLDDEQRQRYGAIYRTLREGGAKVSALDRERLHQWVLQQVTVPQVQEAVQLAKRRRTAEESRQPIGVAYLDAIIADLRKPKSPPWWSSVGAMDAKAVELGIDAARPGESMEQYKGRITAAIRNLGGGQQ